MWFQIKCFLLVNNSIDVEIWHRLWGQFDEGRGVLVVCIEEWREISFDELQINFRGFPDLENGTPYSSTLFDESLDGISPDLIGYADCPLIIGDRHENNCGNLLFWLWFSFGLSPVRVMPAIPFPFWFEMTRGKLFFHVFFLNAY